MQREVAKSRRVQSHAVVGIGARKRPFRLGGVEPQEGLGVDLAPPGKAMGVDDLRRPRAERIGVEGQQHRRIAKARGDGERSAEGLRRPGKSKIVTHRLVAIPARLRILLQQRIDLTATLLAT